MDIKIVSIGTAGAIAGAASSVAGAVGKAVAGAVEAATANRANEWYDLLTLCVQHNRLPYRVLLYGPPGTGKSSWPAHQFPKVERLAITEDTAPEEFLGQWLLKRGDMAFFEGAVVRAMKGGVPLVLDEIDRAGPAIESLLHAVLDDPSISAITLPTGEVVRPKQGFSVFGTMNAPPSALQEPILDRFEMVLPCKMPVPAILQQIDPDLRKLTVNFYARVKMEPWRPTISVRRVLAFCSFKAWMAQEQAARAAFGDNYKDVLGDLVAAGKA